MKPRATLLAGLVLAIWGQGAVAEDRLTPLLRFVPASAFAGGGAAEAVTFADLDALRLAVASRLSLADAFTWGAQDRELAAMFRLNTLPTMLAPYVQQLMAVQQPMADYLGFGWSDIGQVVGFAQPPVVPLIVTGTDAVTDEATIGAALTGRGFAAEQRDGHTLWWRGEDNAMDLANRDPDDPLRGHLGGSARAGVVDGAFIAAGAWGVIDVMLAAVAGREPTARDMPDMIALAHALDQPVTADGTLLQAYLFAGAVGMTDLIAALGRDATDEARAALEARLRAEAANGPSTPRYAATALADRQEGRNPVGLVALSYADRADAELAVVTVPAAFAAGVSLVSGAPFSEVLPFEVVADVVAAPAGDRFVARIAFVMEPEGPLETPGDNRLVPFVRLIQMLYSRDLAPLAATE